MARADKNGDGVIEYDEVVVLMKGFCKIDDGAEGGQQQTKKKKLGLSGYATAQLGKYMQKLFKIADKDGNGTLDRQELSELLGWSGSVSDTPLTLPLMTKADKTVDGVFEYDEFRVLLEGVCEIDDGAKSRQLQMMLMKLDLSG